MTIHNIFLRGKNIYIFTTEKIFKMSSKTMEKQKFSTTSLNVPKTALKSGKILKIVRKKRCDDDVEEKRLTGQKTRPSLSFMIGIQYQFD